MRRQSLVKLFLYNRNQGNTDMIKYKIRKSKTYFYSRWLAETSVRCSTCPLVGSPFILNVVREVSQGTAKPSLIKMSSNCSSRYPVGSPSTYHVLRAPSILRQTWIYLFTLMQNSCVKLSNISHSPTLITSISRGPRILGICELHFVWPASTWLNSSLQYSEETSGANLVAVKALYTSGSSANTKGKLKIRYRSFGRRENEAIAL